MILIMKSLNKFLRLVTKLEYLIMPSLSVEEGHIHKLLLWGTRIYYVYSGLLWIIIKGLDYFNIYLDYWFFLIIFMIQAGILFYIIQTYRRFYVISFRYKRSIILQSLFFLWLMVFLFASVDQIIGIPIFSSSILFFITGGRDFFISDFFANWIYLAFFFTILSISGEYLLRKISRKEVIS